MDFGFFCQPLNFFVQALSVVLLVVVVDIHWRFVSWRFCLVARGHVLSDSAVLLLIKYNVFSFQLLHVMDLLLELPVLILNSNHSI